jgi:hypothetical protein
MRQAHARKISDAYLDAPKRSERHLHVVEVPSADDTRLADEARLLDDMRVVEDLRVEAPLVDIPDWAEPFSDPTWDDRLGGPDYEERDGRRTVLVTGRPEGKALPRRDSSPAPSARKRRQTPTRARLAGRPDRVALWAVGLALVMAAMAGFSGNGSGHATQGAASQPAAPALSSR